MKKILAIFILGLGLLPMLTMPVYAADDDGDSTEETAPTYDLVKPDFLPGPSESLDDGESVQEYFLNTTIPRAINIGIGLLGLAAFLGILISAITMLTAYGNEDKVNRGKTTLRYSLIGFVVVMLAYAIVSIIVSISLPKEETPSTSWIPSAYAATNVEDKLDLLLPGQEEFIEDQDDKKRVSLPSGDFITEILPAIVTNILFAIGFLVFIAIIYGGILLVIGRGNEESTTKAKQIIIYSAIALGLVATGYAIIYGIATLNLKNDATTDSDDVFTEAIDQ